jgi:hypothetical protein
VFARSVAFGACELKVTDRAMPDLLTKTDFQVPYRRHTGAQFKSAILIAIFMIFITSFTQMPRQYPKQGDDCFLPIPFEYIIR